MGPYLVPISNSEKFSGQCVGQKSSGLTRTFLVQICKHSGANKKPFSWPVTFRLCQCLLLEVFLLFPKIYPLFGQKNWLQSQTPSNIYIPFWADGFCVNLHKYCQFCLHINSNGKACTDQCNCSAC